MQHSHPKDHKGSPCAILLVSPRPNPVRWNQGPHWVYNCTAYTDPRSCVLTTQAEKDLTAGLAKMAAPPKLQSCKGSLSTCFLYQRLNSQSAVVNASSVHDFGTLHVSPEGNSWPHSQDIAAPTC
mmetsp:Transcript_15611/g.32526  ORF Transcript_15611/g.32526 Transcript_15611/m.32526 type:complete len:125 (-) Transcript_15611:1538-1912(-)